MTMTENERREREAFEAWARLENHDLRRWPAPDGTYADSLTGFMWDAWKARASLRASPAVPVAQDERAEALQALVEALESFPGFAVDIGDERDTFVRKGKVALSLGRAALSAATPPAAVPMSRKTQDGHSVSSVAEAPTTPPPDPQLCKFYAVETWPELVAAMLHHITKLQAKLPPTPSLAPQRVREG